MNLLKKQPMTPKQKAAELIDKFSERTKLMDPYHGWVEHVILYKAKGYALTAVNEILNNDKVMPYIIISYWKEVKKELEKL